MKKNTADKILQETELGYNLIAQKFSQTRKHFWRGLEFIRDYTRENDNVLDFGCGNGRLLELIGKTKNIKYLGVDVSGKLIDIAKVKYGSENIYPVKSAEGGAEQFNRVNFEKIDPSQSTIALENNFFNTIYSIAVFHHFPSRKYRQDVARELYQITADGGHVVVTAWHLWQGKYFKNILKNWADKISGKSVLDWNDCLISFTDNQGKKFERFHHAFTKRELRKLFESAGFETEKCEVADGRNILYIGKKG